MVWLYRFARLWQWGGRGVFYLLKSFVPAFAPASYRRERGEASPCERNCPPPLENQREVHERSSLYTRIYGVAMRITRENRNCGFFLRWLAFSLASRVPPFRGWILSGLTVFGMQVPTKHLTSLKSTNPDRSENQPIRQLGGKNQPMTDRVWIAGINKTLTLIEGKTNQSESLAGKTSLWLTVSGMQASIKHQPWSMRKSTNQKAWREKPANDWPCLESKQKSTNQKP